MDAAYGGIWSNNEEDMIHEPEIRRRKGSEVVIGPSTGSECSQSWPLFIQMQPTSQAQS
jgi:hypothetical protein